MEEMQKEGLSSHSASIEFSDNQSLIDVLEQAPSGIFRQIDEASTMKSTDEILLSSIRKKWKDSGFLSFSKTSSPVFTINHTATSITYTIDGFVSKNIDEVRPEFETFLCKSEEKTLKIVFRADEVKGKFIGEKFRKEVGILFQEISDSRTWFVRCIKPNEDKSPWKFDQRVVLNQIQYLGLLDSIMIRKKGFPVRISHEKFFENYKILKGFGFTEKIDDFFKFSEEFIRKLNSPEILLGKNKVFMKADAQEVLKNMKKERISLVENHVRRIQGWTRAQNMYENFKKLQKSVRVIQNAWKSHQNLKNFQMVRKKVVTIQRWYRSILYREQIAMKEFGLQIFYQYLKIKIEDLFLEKCFNLAIKTQKLFRGHRVRRLLKGKTLINKIFQKKSCKPAFDSILRETKEVSATRIQKTFRGYQIRSKITPQFTQMIQKNKKNRMATRIQKWFKGQLIRLKLLKITSAAVKIQSFMRSKLCQKHYLSTLTSLIKIQSSVRSYLTRSKAIRSRLHSFLSKETALINNLTVLELELLQSKHRKSEDSSSCQKVLRTLSNFSEVSQITSPKDPNLNISHHSNISHYSNISHNLNLSQISSHSQIHSKQVTPFHVEKIYFSLRPFEIEVLSDESVIYEGLWGRLLDCLAKDLSVKDEHVLDLAVGTCHSLALTSKGRLFAWGWNDKNQCGSNGNRPRLVDSGKDLKFVQVSAGEDHSLALASNGMVFAFGDNSRGQLGQGNYCEIKQGALLEIPSCKQVLAVNHQNMAVSASGELFIWPFETFNGEKRSFPMKVLNDFSVSEVTAGFNFAVILTTAGIVFSLGSENSFGQLGHGDLAPRSLPTMVLALKSFGEKIASVGCGQSHVIAKSTLGKVFTWGKGTEGQLGHGSLSNEYYPRLVTFRTQGKPIQISAGFRHSLVLTDSRKVLLSGKSSRFESVSSIFQEVNLSSTIQELQKIPSEFAVVRIHSIWSKIFSVMLVTLVDLRFLQGNSAGFSKVSNNLGLIASKWTGQNPEPPVIESISGFYPACLTRRAVKGGSIKTGKSVKGSEEVKEVVRDILRKPKEKWTSEDCATIECYASYEH
jgi:alpha-tubulin suppressor-like RCC1 family protein